MNKGSPGSPNFISDFPNVPNLSAGSKTFEVYIFAAGYKRDKADSKVPGMEGRALVLCATVWCLGLLATSQALRSEASLKILGGWGLSFPSFWP